MHPAYLPSDVNNPSLYIPPTCPVIHPYTSLQPALVHPYAARLPPFFNNGFFRLATYFSGLQLYAGDRRSLSLVHSVLCFLLHFYAHVRENFLGSNPPFFTYLFVAASTLSSSISHLSVAYYVCLFARGSISVSMHLKPCISHEREC